MTNRDASARFAAFYREHYSLILTVCERRLSDRKAAEDAAAEVFRIAWQQFVEGREPELAWVYGIVRNVVGNEYRRVERAGALARRLLPAPIVDSTSSTHRVLEVRRTLLSLRPADRELLFMAYWEDLTPAEMAAILGCTLATLAVRLNRARAAFRRRLPDPVPLAAREVTSLG